MHTGDELTESLEDYLEAIYRLILEKNVARVKDIAAALKVRYPSVTVAVGALEKRGLITHERYGGINLTKSGYEAAVKVTERHRMLRSFFANVLGCPADLADETACRVEHVLPPPIFTRLAKFVKYLYISHDDADEWIRSFSRFAEDEGALGIGKNDMDSYFDGTGFLVQGESHDD